jgi:hypothetical protein
MAEPVEDEEVVVSPLELSDEDLLEFKLPEAEKAELIDDEEEEDEEELPVEEEEDDEDEPPVEDPIEPPEPEVIAEEGKKAEPVEPVVPAKDTFDYEGEYKKLLAPFRANGREMSVNNVDDALSLMKMGANYNKKMAGLKPNLKLMKMLSNNDLLDEGKLSYLIDINKKDPDAIAKLLKDSGIDPLEVDVEKSADYHPKTYTVEDDEVELDGTLDNIRDTKSYAATMDIIGNKWDESSKRVLFANPHIIEVINDHVGSGVYDQIHQVIESERMLGRLKGVSDIEAYKAIGDKIQAAGGFTDSVVPTETTTPILSQPAKKKPIDPNLKKRKKAAAATKSSPAKGIPTDFNPLNMSDEEFAKVSIQGLS